MSCLACTKRFGFFTKEVGCPSCGFAYCSKCLKKPIEVTRLNNKKLKVCLTCYDRISKAADSSNTSSAQMETNHPMDAENLPEIDVLPTPITVRHVFEHTSAENDPGDADDVIKQRLAKLKEDRMNRVHLQPASDQDIAIRIANLKGERYVENSKDPALLLATDTRSDQEKTNDLVARYMAEAQLDEAADPIKDIERRLAALKGPIAGAGTSSNSNTQVRESDSDDEETKIKRLVGRYIDEAALIPAIADPELTAEEQEFVASVRPGKDQEELPWCVICNEDADIRYQGDLFCKQCYKEAREDE